MDTTPESSGYYDFPGESFLSGRNALRPYKRTDDGKHRLVHVHYRQRNANTIINNPHLKHRGVLLVYAGFYYSRFPFMK